VGRKKGREYGEWVGMGKRERNGVKVHSGGKRSNGAENRGSGGGIRMEISEDRRKLLKKRYERGKAGSIDDRTAKGMHLEPNLWWEGRFAKMGETI